MLEDAVADLRAGEGRRGGQERDWTPNISLGLPVLIPEDYVRDLPVRLGLYRRIGALASDAETEAMAAELVDRFGPLPKEVENLLQVVALKRACREAGVEKLEAGPKGMVLSFRGNAFSNPAGLVALAVQQGRAGAAASRPQAGDLARDGCGDAAEVRARYAGQSGADLRAGEGGIAVRGADCDVQVHDEAVGNGIDPAVHAERLPTRPGILHEHVGCHVAHLAHDVQLA